MYRFFLGEKIDFESPYEHELSTNVCRLPIMGNGQWVLG